MLKKNKKTNTLRHIMKQQYYNAYVLFTLAFGFQDIISGAQFGNLT